MTQPFTVVGNPTDRTDPWTEVNGPNYDEDTFYVGYHGKNGSRDSAQWKHGDKVVRVSTALDGVVQGLVARGDVPYKTVQDFVRDASMHRAKFLVDKINDPVRASELQRVVDTALIEHMIFFKRQQFDEREDLLRRVKDSMLAMQGRGDAADLVELYQQATLLADEWSEFQQGTDLTAFLRQFEHLRRRAGIKSI